MEADCPLSTGKWMHAFHSPCLNRNRQGIRAMAVTIAIDDFGQDLLLTKLWRPLCRLRPSDIFCDMASDPNVSAMPVALVQLLLDGNLSPDFTRRDGAAVHIEISIAGVDVRHILRRQCRGVGARIHAGSLGQRDHVGWP